MRRKQKHSIVTISKKSAPSKNKGSLFKDIRSLIEKARERVAQTIDSGLVLLYWNIGSRIRKEILAEKKADYGEQIIQTLSGKLTAQYGQGFSRPNLFKMVRFSERFPNAEIVSTLSRQLVWSHFLKIIYLKDPLQRDFYAEMCRIEHWSVRMLRQRVDSMLFVWHREAYGA